MHEGFMNKQTLVIAGVAIAILIAGIFTMRFIGSDKGDQTEEEPTPTIAYQEVDDSVQATLTANSAKTKVTVTVTGLNSRFSQIEYELSYETTNNGTQGAFSNEPIDISGQDTFEREVELGSCSTGGKCTYDKGVKNFKLTAKLHTSDGQIFLLRKEFPSI